jgi:CIC family chloride channel protein
MADPLTTLAEYPRRWSRATGVAGARLISQLESWGMGEPAILTSLAVLVGILAGLSVLLFYRSIDVAAAIVSRVATVLEIPSALVAAATLIIGLLVVRLLVHYGTGDSDGENIPDMMHAVARRGGVLNLRPVAIKTLASAVTLGSGGSLGAEGPVAVLGAAVGSRAGRWLGFNKQRLRLLLSCGAAAGLSAAFGAPIAGVLFVLEKLVGSFRTSVLAPIVVASVSAAAVTRVGLGRDQVIRIPTEYHFGGPRDLILYAAVGLVGGCVGVLYARMAWKVPDWLRPLPRWLRLVFAAVLVAAVASRFSPELWGRGHQGLDLGLVTERTALVLFALCFAKIAATSLTLGGGGVGGVFTPALVVGGTFGAAAGVALAQLMPGWDLQPVAFALVGMAAVVGAATHAPLTAVFMVLEMSGDYGLILPILLGGTLAYVVAKPLYKQSIYTEWLARRGEHITHGTDESVLAALTVADAYRPEAVVLPAQATLGEVLAQVRQAGQLEFPVVDEANVVVGMLTWDELKGALADGARDRRVADLADPPRAGVTLQDDLRTALRLLRERDAHLLPVLDGIPPHHLRGVIGRSEIFAAYERAAEEEE